MPTGVITTGNYARALYPGVKKWYQTGYNDWKEEFKELFDMDSSSQAYEIEVGTVDTGLAPVKPQGQAVEFDSMQAGFESRYTHATYALGIIVTKEEFDDNLYPKLIKKRGRALARSLRQTKENLGANIYNRAFNPNFTGPDGLELCSLLHLRKDGSTWANEAAAPADISELALEQACIDIGKFTDERGLRIQAIPRSLHVSIDQVFDARRILGSNLQNDTANNATNALKDLEIFPEGVKVNHYFSDVDAFFIRTNVEDGLRHYTRQKPEVLLDNDSDTFNAKYITHERYSFGWSDPRAIYGVPGI